MSSPPSAAAGAAAAPPPACLDPSREWVRGAMLKLQADLQRSADTHLIPLALPAFPAVHFYMKDESVHPSGSLKHRLARSLFLYAIVNGWVAEGTTVIENSSGSTAVSEAYFARLLGLRFIAVCPASTSPQKLAAIARYHGEVHHVERAEQCEAECRALAAATPNAHFMDQFEYAERATDFRANNNIAESLFSQMAREAHPEPAYVVCGAGTGGTSATLGRYVRYQGKSTCVVVADPENSVFYEHFVGGDPALRATQAGIIEGIGRSRVEHSFIRTAVDAM
jgi:cysteine synthase A